MSKNRFSDLLKCDDEASAPVDVMADIPIPTGPWTIYYHSSPQKQQDFTDLATFKLGTKVTTFAQFWAMWDQIGDETLLDGYFYIMRDGHPPIWEDPKNFRGGTYTLRIRQDDHGTPITLYYTYAIAAMLGELAKNPENKITGVRISNKRGFNIMHIWNEDSTKFNDPNGIKLYHTPNPGDEVRYEAVCDKRF